jgi:flavin reductase (DIM6/NTAB) family NADH-FMN oxidoreductase RutF
MSGKSGGGLKSSPAERTGFECAAEASALLNCLVRKDYKEGDCAAIVKKLRACIVKEVRCFCHVAISKTLHLP